METQRMNHHRRGRLASGLAALLIAPMLTVVMAAPSQAATSKACDGGAFKLVNLSTNTVIASGEGGAKVDRSIAASAFGANRFGVRGRYVEFDIGLADFAIFDFTFTGAPNPLDLTGGRRTPVFASKIPDHRGLKLTSGIDVKVEGGDLVLSRTGSGLSMKIQAKDCAQGGIFQMEPERADGTRTRIVHTLAQSSDPKLTPFYFDNPEFRARVGQFLGSGCTSVQTGPPGQFCVQVGTRVNIANGLSPAFVARDSAQVATRVVQADCNTASPLNPSVRHCGGISVWDVASGGRMGFVTGEDAVEVANPPTDCVTKCQAQNRVRGRLAVLGFPFPVPQGSQLVPRFSGLALPPLTPPPAN
jgi:hypothetical protein